MNRCFDRRVGKVTDDRGEMKNATGALVVGVVALVCGIVGASASAGSAFRFGAYPRAGVVVYPRAGVVVARVAIPAGPGAFAVGERAVWAVSDAGPTVTRIDPGGNVAAASIALTLGTACPAEPPGCGEAAAGEGAIWVTHLTDNTVSRIDPGTNTVAATINVGPRPRGVAVSRGAVWVANSGGPTVSRIDPATNRVVATIRVGPARAVSDHMSVTAGGGAVWVGVPSLNAVVRIDPVTNAVVSTIRAAGQTCGFLVADQNAVWAAGAHCDNDVVRINPRSNRRAGQVSGPLFVPIGVALGFGSLWVADLDTKTIDRVNPRTGRILARLAVGGYPVHLETGFGSVWVRDDAGRVVRIRPQR
jgi:virginiamycin B lyase